LSDCSFLGKNAKSKKDPEFAPGLFFKLKMFLSGESAAKASWFLSGVGIK